MKLCKFHVVSQRFQYDSKCISTVLWYSADTINVHIVLHMKDLLTNMLLSTTIINNEIKLTGDKFSPLPVLHRRLKFYTV